MTHETQRKQAAEKGREKTKKCVMRLMGVCLCLCLHMSSPHKHLFRLACDVICDMRYAIFIAACSSFAHKYMGMHSLIATSCGSSSDAYIIHLPLCLSPFFVLRASPHLTLEQSFHVLTGLYHATLPLQTRLVS